MLDISSQWKTVFLMRVNRWDQISSPKGTSGGCPKPTALLLLHAKSVESFKTQAKLKHKTSFFANNTFRWLTEKYSDCLQEQHNHQNYVC